MAGRADWHYSIEGKRIGPVSEEELKQLHAAGTVRGSDLVWTAGMAEWKPLSRVRSLSGDNGPPPLPSSSPEVAGLADDKDSESAYRDFIGKKTAAGICGILFGGFGVHKFILGLTTPAVIMLCISIASFGTGFCLIVPFMAYMAMHVIGLVEGIMYLTKTDREFYHRYAVEKQGWF